MNMNKNIRATFLLVTLIVFCSTSRSIAVIVVLHDEVWDGIANPHEVDGVTLLGGVYTIPEELVISSNATVFLNDPATRYDDPLNIPSNSITWQFTAGTGGLTFMDMSSTIDVHAGSRNGPLKSFTLNMSDNDIKGDGQIINGPAVNFGETGDSMSVNINSAADVKLGTINIRRNDSREAGINIRADGFVDIGALLNPDVHSSGFSVMEVNVTGQSLRLGQIDTRAFRADNLADNGNVNLVALAPPTFDINNELDNSPVDNTITLTGNVTTNSPARNNNGGNVRATAVKVVLESGFSLDLSENATALFRAGTTSSKFTEADLFMDMASSGFAADFTVLHNEVPEPSSIALLLSAGYPLLGLRISRWHGRHCD